MTTAKTYKGGASVDEVRSRVKAGRIYKLSSNENPLGPSPLALAAVNEEMANLNRYPPRNDSSLRRALAQFHALDESCFFTGSGGFEVLELVARSLLTGGDEVIICPPTFGVYARTAQAQGAVVVEVPLKEDFALDVAALLEAVTPRTRIVYLCNPNNPTGTVSTKAEFETLLNALPEGVVLVHDDVYGDFVERGDFPDSLEYLPHKAFIAVRTFSKVYGLAGLRLGYGITSPDLAEKMRTQHRTFHLSSVSLAAGIGALADSEHLKKSLALVREGKQYLYEEFEKLGIFYWPSEANFILFRSPYDAAKLEADLLECGIMIRETARNGLTDCLRVSVGTSEANEAFIAALTELIVDRE